MHRVNFFIRYSGLHKHLIDIRAASKGLGAKETVQERKSVILIELAKRRDPDLIQKLKKIRLTENTKCELWISIFTSHDIEVFEIPKHILEVEKLLSAPIVVSLTYMVSTQ
ncbi:MAG: hypothetical protein ACREP2_10875 [Rhodanobacteraceae bacterium]